MMFSESLLALEARIKKLDYLANNDPILENRDGHRRALKTQTTKYELYLKNDKCCFCEIIMFADSNFGVTNKNRIATIEHILPKSKGGQNSKKNYTLSCYSCNSHRGNRDFDEFKNELIKKNFNYKKLSTSTKNKKTKTTKKFLDLAWALFIHYTETEIMKNVS